jgi:ketosteroid isomerase-like protein
MSLPIEDVLKLQRLYAEYVQLFDRGDRDKWLDLFTEDILYRVVPRNTTGEWADPIDLVGHQALSDYWDYRKDMYEHGARHFSTDLIVDGDGDQATGSAHSMVVLSRPTGPVFRITGYLEDEMRRDAGGTWRFSLRTAHPDL